MSTRKDNKQIKATSCPEALSLLRTKIVTDIVSGLSRKRILHKLENNLYNMGYKTSDYAEESRINIYRSALNELKVECEGKREELRSVIYERFLDVYSRALERNELSNAISALKEIKKMLGLDEPDTLNVNDKKTIVIDFGFADDNEVEEEEKSDGEEGEV